MDDCSVFWKLREWWIFCMLLSWVMFMFESKMFSIEEFIYNCLHSSSVLSSIEAPNDC